MPKYTSDDRLRRIAEQNALFLRHLRATGNVTMSAQLAGSDSGTMRARRAKDFDFDAEWSAAAVFAQGALARKGGAAPVDQGGGDNGMVAAGGEYMIGANLNRGLQVRRARPGHVTAKGEQAFLAALAATANIRLAAESVGVDGRAFYKRRAQSAAFAAAMADALAAGYEAVEFALLKTALRTLAPESEGADADAEGAPVQPEPLERMTVDQALALVAQRRKTMAINDRHKHDTVRPYPTSEEVDAKLNARLDALARRLAKEAERKALRAPGSGPGPRVTEAEPAASWREAISARLEASGPRLAIE